MQAVAVMAAVVEKGRKIAGDQNTGNLTIDAAHEIRFLWMSV
jgi:hypothetical protein